MKNAIPYIVMEVGERYQAPVGSIPVNMYGLPTGSGEGTPGPQGDPGPQGEQGPQGPQGIPGPAGLDGADGSQGPAGQSGGEGAQGVQGPRGERGSDGTSVVIDGYVQAEADLPDLTGSAAGPSYIVMDTGHIHFWNGTSFTDGGNVTGPAGADGAPGTQGPVGGQGLQGIQGAQGPKGDRGDTGAQGGEGPQGPQGLRGPGVPVGGSAGQVLVKTGPGEEATAWSRERVVVNTTVTKTAATDHTVGTFRVRVMAGSVNVAYFQIFALTGTKVVDVGSNQGTLNATTTLNRHAKDVTITTTSGTSVVGNGSFATFMFRAVNSGECWMGTMLAPTPGDNNLASNVTIVFDRVA